MTVVYPTRENGLYRSADQALVGGVLAGIAKKWHINLLALRIVTLLCSPMLIGVGLYVLAWASLPAVPTAK